MKTKFNGILTLLLAFVVQISFAQQKTISGTVSDESGSLPGVSVLIKGTTIGTETDFDGKYSIKAKSGDVLVFRYLGYKTLEKTVSATNTINITMIEGGEVLDEIIVTALGIERNERELGYAVTTLKSEDINEVKQTDVIGALQGKTSGVQITNQSGNLGGSTRIIIRGISSLQGGQQPLWVVDGVPISNANVASGSRITGGFDFGNRAQDINPDDIASISILKGASAAALYGSRASGGVIVVTTKKGKVGSKSSIQFSTDVRFDTPLRLPDFQNSFVSGDQGVYDFNETNGDQVTSGWGPALNDPSLANQTFTNLRGDSVPFQAFSNGPKEFYQTGSTRINSLSVSGASEEGNDYRLSLTHTEQEGLIPGASLNRLNLGMNAGRKFSDKLRSRFSINYVRTNTKGTAAAGANDPNVLSGIVNGSSILTDFSLFKDYKDPISGDQINNPSALTNNPYWIAHENAPKFTVQRFFGNASLQYLPFDNFDVLGRVGYDTFTDTRLLQNSIGTIGNLLGGFRDDLINRRELTIDLIATYKKELNEDLNFTVRGGAQWNERVLERFGNIASELTVPELFDPGNANVNAPYKDFRQSRIFGAFGDVTVNYKNWLILNATGRNDWSSTLPIANNSFFYPSVSLSWIFTDALNIDSNILSYGKLRGSWANVGVDTNSYLLDYTYNPDTGFFQQFGQGGTFPFDGALAFNSDTSITNPNLKPENQNTFEIGFEVGLLKNRINIDATYYNNVTQDQIITVDTPQTTGFSGLLTNIGQISNKGIELQINSKVIRTENFSWDLNYNYTANEFRVDNLGDDLEALDIANEFNGIQIRAVEGEDLQLFGRRWVRAQDADGNDIDDQILVDSNGLRQVGTAENLGSINPDFTMGLTSVFRYKGFSLSTTFDYRQGGKFFSATVGALRRSGLAAETAANNRAPFVDPNTFQLDGSGNVVPNTTEVNSVQNYWGEYADASVAEGNVFDGTFIKWREVSLTYAFSQKVLDKTPFQSLQFAVQGRNLALFNTDVPHVDPESSIGGSASNLQGIERGGIPPTRSFGFNIKANF